MAGDDYSGPERRKKPRRRQDEETQEMLNVHLRECAEKHERHTDAITHLSEQFDRYHKENTTKFDALATACAAMAKSGERLAGVNDDQLKVLKVLGTSRRLVIWGLGIVPTLITLMQLWQMLHK